MYALRPAWPEVPFGKILTYLDERVELDDMTEYLTITVKRRHGGLEAREKLFGHQIKTKKQFRLFPRSFIISRVQCWHQAYALVPDNVPPTMIASTNYDQFAISPEVDRRFFWWLSYSPKFTETVRNSAMGVVIEKMVFDRQAWLKETIPLPPLPEQHRIVARIEALASKIHQVRQLQKEVFLEFDSLCRSMIFNWQNSDSQLTPMRDLVSLREPDILVRSEETYNFAGVYCFGRGVFKGQSKSGLEFAYSRLTRLNTNEFVYPKLMAWEGALGIVPAECDGLFVSPEFPVFKVNENRVLPEVLDVYFRTPWVWPLLAGVSTGTNVRRRRLNPKDFLSYQMPLPPMSTQEKLAKVKTKVDAQKKLQSESAAELNALLPSILDKAFKGDL